MTSTDSETPVRFESAHPRSRRRLLWWLVIPIAAMGWWLGSPLFLDDAVDEAFPIVTTAASGSRSVQTTQATASASPAETGTTVETSAEPVILQDGMFSGFDAVHQGSGSATIYDLDGTPVLRFEEFDVTNGPDLRVDLVLADGAMVDLGALKGNVGDQNYDIPSDVDLGEVESVLIYCRAFSVPFAEASLS